MEQRLLADMLLLSHAVRWVLQEEILVPFRDRGLNLVRLGILNLLSRRGRQPVSALAQCLHLSKAAASQNVDRLVRLGFVTRHVDDHDRRTVWIRITADGTELLGEAEALQRSSFRKFLRKLPGRSRTLVDRNLREIANALLSVTREPFQSCLQCCAFGSPSCVLAPEGDSWSCAFAPAGLPSVTGAVRGDSLHDG